MANDQEQLNSELNKVTKELESLLAKQAETIEQQKKYEADFKKQYKINNISELEESIPDQTGPNGEASDLEDEEEDNLSETTKINYVKLKEEYMQKIKEFEKQQVALVEEISEAQKKQKAFQQQLEELNNKHDLHETEVEKNNSHNADRIEMSSSSPIKARISNNQLQAAHDRLGKEFKMDTDQDSIFLRNTTTNHPTGFKITDEKMIAVNKQPLDAQACEKMLQAGKELYGNKLVVYAPTEAEKKHMEEAAKKLNIECTVTTSKEEHQRLMDEHSKKMETPKPETKAMPQSQPVANNVEKAHAKKADTPIQMTNPPNKPTETTQHSNDDDLEATDVGQSSPRFNN